MMTAINRTKKALVDAGMTYEEIERLEAMAEEQSISIEQAVEEAKERYANKVEKKHEVML